MPRNAIIAAVGCRLRGAFGLARGQTGPSVPGGPSKRSVAAARSRETGTAADRTANSSVNAPRCPEITAAKARSHAPAVAADTRRPNDNDLANHQPVHRPSSQGQGQGETTGPAPVADDRQGQAACHEGYAFVGPARGQPVLESARDAKELGRRESERVGRAETGRTAPRRDRRAQPGRGRRSMATAFGRGGQAVSRRRSSARRFAIISRSWKAPRSTRSRTPAAMSM